MDYLINGGYSDEVITLIHYEIIRELNLYGDYLKEANKVLENREEEPILEQVQTSGPKRR